MRAWSLDATSKIAYQYAWHEPDRVERCGSHACFAPVIDRLHDRQHLLRATPAFAGAVQRGLIAPTIGKPMPISELSAIERVARVLAGQQLSINAEGYETSASDEVDAEWHLYVGRALAVLKTLREPDLIMANAGDTEIWRNMIEAAIGDFEGDGEAGG
jgi:hypothetical protein